MVNISSLTSDVMSVTLALDIESLSLTHLWP